MKKNFFSKIKIFFRNKTAVVTSIIVVMVLFGVVFKTGIVSRLFSFSALLNTGYTSEVKEITVNGTGYTNNTAGSIKYTKSAEWTGKQEVTVTYDIDSLAINRNMKQDVILVLDVSLSMDSIKLGDLKRSLDEISSEFFDNTGNRMAIITFSTDAKTNLGFTSDYNAVKTTLDGLEVRGSTNYYLALKEVDKLLSSYTKKSDTDLHMIFFTDGLPTEGMSMYKTQYNSLKAKHSYLRASAIQYEMGDEIVTMIEDISDYQFFALNDKEREYVSLESVFKDAIAANDYYNSVTLTDYIHNQYFEIDPNQVVDVSYGDVAITSDGNNQKLVWNIPKNKLKSGTILETKLKYKIKLKDEYANAEAYFPVNKSISLAASSSANGNYNFSSTNTPVLQSWYELNYDANVPAGCSTTYSYIGKYQPFSNVQINSDKLYCLGAQFKGWEVVGNDIIKVNDSNFIMPARNASISAKWTSLSIDKSMIGTVNTRPTLYRLIANQAVSDSSASTYVTNDWGISYGNISSDTNGKGIYRYDQSLDYDDYPVYFYRGDVNNNNVLFANLCWKIVRTTGTGGVKMVYNGKPTGGQCVATGVDTTIGESKYKEYGSYQIESYHYGFENSLAYLGYMYGDAYYTRTADLGADEWGDIYDLRLRYEDIYDRLAYGTTFNYVDQYTEFIIGGTTRTTTTVSESLIGKYTIGSNGPSTAANFMRYIYDVDVSTNTYYYLEFSLEHYQEAGTKDVYNYYLNKAKNDYWVYGNDVTYSNGKYTLVNTASYTPYYYGDNIPLMNGDIKRHYTCKSKSSTCSEVYYFYADVEEYLLASYITLNNGDKIETAFDKMIVNPGYTKSSDVKIAIDTWFENNLNNITYLNMLEDTVWCNHRVVDPYNSAGGWEKDGDSQDNAVFWLRDYYFSCRTQDAFTVNSANGNGKLTYPVGLLTNEEMLLSGSADDWSSSSNTNYYLYNGLTYWTLTPSLHNNLYPKFFYVDEYGLISDSDSVHDSKYIRPAISLKPGVYVQDGNGTQLNPYIIEMN